MNSYESSISFFLGGDAEELEDQVIELKSALKLLVEAVELNKKTPCQPFVDHALVKAKAAIK